MSEIKNVELVIIPSPGMGHLVPAVEMAKLLIAREEHLSITVLVMNMNLKPYLRSLSSNANCSSTRLKFINLPRDESALLLLNNNTFFSGFIERHKPQVRHVVAQILQSKTATLSSFVVDMMCTIMIDVANEFGVPTYVFYTTSAAMLGLHFHMQSLRDDLLLIVTMTLNQNSMYLLGGFVSHCGWNSILESIWFSVPMATWPMYSEQQANAFQLVKDLCMAVDIKIKESNTDVIKAEEIEKAIGHLKDPENGIRLKVKDMKEKSRLALKEGASSYNSVGRLIEQVMGNN
uniref:Glucosyltransferase n=1 Tax=Solanum tuberosum TaxID=4113 RepID=M1DGJ2_SOLTU